MIVKGIIKTIDFLNNSCTVRLPLFETAASSGEVVLKATILTQPGLYNGYVEGDVVFIGFENDGLDQPIVLGKLFLGAAKEEAMPGVSALTVGNLKVASSATLPIDTKLVLDDTGSAVPVDNGITSYKSITDIIKALYKAEANVDQVTKDQSEIIANIEVKYLSQPTASPAPEASDLGWQIASPAYKDGYHIWQKTTCTNHRGQILSTEIICLSSIANTSLYRLRCSTKVHAAQNQLEALSIKAMVKFGSESEIVDEAAKLTYQWGEDGAPITVGPSLYLTAAELQEKNLIVSLAREGVVYDTETIMYAPLNTPLLLLTKENDVILYTADGERKLGDDVSCTASLYVNGDVLDATFDWKWDEDYCSGNYGVDENGDPDTATVIITGVTNKTRTGKAICTAHVIKDGAFKDKEYKKEFAVTQTRVGENATSYWLTSSCTVHTGKKHGQNIIVTAMKQFGTSTEEPDESARLWWKYKNAVDNPATDTNEGEWKLAAAKYRLNFSFPTEFEDDDLLIIATHSELFNPNTPGVDITTDEAIYEKEELTFSPLNTPILSLTNDSAALLYGSNGYKMNAADTVSTTAELYLNGAHITTGVSYSWNLTGCATDLAGTGNGCWAEAEITIKDLTANTATATCNATYKGETYSKTFTVVKQVQGISVVAQTTYYALVHNKYPTKASPVTTLLAPPNNTTLQVQVQTGSDTATKKALARLDQAKNATDVANAETWGEWSITPPAHTEATNGWKYWTTVETLYSAGNSIFSTPIINEDLSGVYALAEGKTTSYYSSKEPTAKTPPTNPTELENYNKKYVYAPSLKEGDCWFYTQSAQYDYELVRDTPPTSKAGYISDDPDNPYYVTPDDNNPTIYIKVDADTIDSLIAGDGLMTLKVGTNKVYKKSYVGTGGALYQYVGTASSGYWEDIGDEIVANKVTANYIHALKITAKRVEVLDSDDTTLFKADGLDGRHEVKIGGFDVVKNTLKSGDVGRANNGAQVRENHLIKLCSDNNKLYEFTEDTDLTNAIANADWGASVASKFTSAFSQKPGLTSIKLVNGRTVSDLFEYSVQNDFQADQTVKSYFAVTKIVFNQSIDSFSLYLNHTSGNTADYMVASTLNASGIPTTYSNSFAHAHTRSKDAVTGVAATYTNIKAGDFIYVLYVHASTSHIATYKGAILIPDDSRIRLSIGDNFQVLSDGTVYARNLFLLPKTNGESGEDAAGKLAAISAELNHLEVKNTAGQIIFKADGRNPTANTTITIGGFTVDNTTLKGGTSGTVGMSSSNASGAYSFWAGHTTPSSAAFSVKNDGAVKATNLTIQNMTASGTAGVTVKGGKFTVQTNSSTPTTLFQVDSSASKTTLSGDIHNMGNIFSGCKLNGDTLEKLSGATGNIYVGGLIQSFGGIINQDVLHNQGILYSDNGIINTGTIASSGLIYSNGGIVNTGEITSTGLIYSSGILAAGSDVVFYATRNGSSISGYKPVIRIETSGSPDCFWSAKKWVNSNTWTTVALPNLLKGNVVSVACSAHQDKETLYRPTNGSGKNDTQYNTAELTAFIANAWYVDYTSDDNNIWIFNGQSSGGYLNIVVAARVM